MHASISYKVQQKGQDLLDTQEIVLPIQEKMGCFLLLVVPIFSNECSERKTGTIAISERTA